MMAATSAQLQSHFVTIKASKMHYYDEGSGNPIVFLHGMPVSAYCWRHVIPPLSKSNRCVAPDLMGMGKSDKPDIDYTVFDHIAYFDAFMEALKLKNVILVMHGWGSVIGMDYARRHEKNIRGLVFYESHIKPTKQWNDLSLPVQQFATLLHRPGASYRAVVQQNYLIEKLLPRSVISELSESEMQVYRAPFPTPESRKPLWQYMNELPLGKPSPVTDLIAKYSAFLEKTTIPKLLLYAVPGFTTTIETVHWAKEHFPQLTLVGLDNALYLAQESIPDELSRAIKKWCATI